MPRRMLICCVLALALPSPAAADDGGSATYTARGSTYDFALTNTGATAWQSFSLTAPAGSVFVGGTTWNEASAHCVVGPPTTIVCGPLSTYGLAAGAAIGFTGVLEAPVACGAPFALAVSATGVQPFTPVGNAVFAGSCTPPRVVRPVRIRRVGRHAFEAVSPVWSEQPATVHYQWQRCNGLRCTAIRGAMNLRIAGVRVVVRVVVTAVFDDGTRLSSSSPRS